MSKLFKEIPRMNRIVKIVEQYNNFKQLGIEDDIRYLKKRINDLYTIKESTILIESAMWCAKMINLYYDMVDSEFKKNCIEEENLENLD